VSSQIVTKSTERSQKEMQMCGNCMKVYDESEYARCPFCSKNKDEYTHVSVFDKKAGVAKSLPKKKMKK
jgi:predicted amidophosphoribosyltransferase